MNILVFSDSHGEAKRIEDVLRRQTITPDAIFFLGDGLRDIAWLNTSDAPLFSVRGNCDAEIDQMLLEFPIMAEYSYVFADGLSMLLTHGHKINTDSAANLKDGEILIHGHTHVLCIREFGRGNIYLNPGSTTYPKEGNPPSYMTYENGVFEIKHLESGEIIKKIDLRKE